MCKMIEFVFKKIYKTLSLMRINKLAKNLPFSKPMDNFIHLFPELTQGR